MDDGRKGTEMEEFEIGARVARDLKKDGKSPAMTAYGTVAYVKPDRIGVVWDARAPYVFPAKRSELRIVAEQVNDS